MVLWQSLIRDGADVHLYNVHGGQRTADSGAFAQTLKGAMPVVVIEVGCMSGCIRAQTVDFCEAGKVAYLFGDIGDADIPDLRNFAALYAASEDGYFEDARLLGTLRTKALARIPGV